MDSRELFEQTRESVKEMERQGRLLRKLEACASTIAKH